MKPQNRRDGKHHEVMINDFRALLDITEDAIHCAAIYIGTQEFVKQRCHYTTYISDEQLHTKDLCIYHGINVHAEGLEGGRISQMCRCTGSQSCCRGDGRNDGVWVNQHPERSYGALNGRLP